ncbi:MAG TPA: alpha/beta fold hydrolase [Candidatus Copromorpha excrementigallinarum]|uniref:Alpha/beta fold hydrolase n=1 Tax=Candidatus Allocopromorpha excrementigallinarum TaxID=2840742 RepID=A0A9D1L4T9_9FIRM|nr:alpha/beta fold hydrolase [Candidatus Copromorpha excrementigallinarum]
MYEEFLLKENREGKIWGYLWDLENPERVVCIIHGIGEYGGRFDRVAGRFREEGSAVVSMDLRGHGKSLGKKGCCAPRKKVLSDIDSLISWAADRYEGKKIVLYGHSMGGNIALDYRKRGSLCHIPSAYLISAPWIELVRPVPGRLYKAVKLFSKIAPDFTVGSSVKEEYLGNPGSVKPYSENPMIHNRISLLCALEGFETGMKLEKGLLEGSHRSDSIPVMIMHGGSDRICSPQASRRTAETMRKNGENVEYIELPGIYHEIHNGGGESCGDEVIEAMINWIRGAAG